MINEVVINNVASFKNEQSFETNKRINLFYGLNGAGKTTISNFLQDLDSQDFSDCRINGFDNTKHKILAYNQNFVQDTFYESETQKGIFTLGEDNKEAKQNIENAEKKILALNSKLDNKQGKGLTIDLTDKNKEITNIQLTSQNKIWEIIQNDKKTGENIFDKNDFFKGYNSKEKLFNHILSLTLSVPQKSIEQIKQELQDLGDGATKRDKLALLKHQSFLEIENNEIFKEVIIGNESSSVSGLISELKNSDWVKAGLDNYVDLDKSNTCPFCQHDTLDDNLINEIKNYFDVTYTKKKNQLKELNIQYKGFKDNLNLEYYKKDFYTQEQNLELEKLFNDVVGILDTNIGLINNKLQNLSQSVQIVSSENYIDKLNNFITNINGEIDSFNTKLNNREQTIRELKKEFWQIQRKEYDQTISTYLTNHKKLEKERKSIQNEIGKINSDIGNQRLIISQNQTKISNIEKTIEKINAHLLDFGISDFKIVLHNKEEKTYKLQRGDNSENIFQTLSEGEKTVISFLYFVELCIGEEDQEEVKEKIVVIDDPISSLSHIYVFNIAELLKKYFITEDSKFLQCFVLTHNLYFFRELINKKSFYKNVKEVDQIQKLFRITKNTHSIISDMKLDEVKTEYQSYWTIVKDGNAECANKFIVANAMRNIIEYFFGFMEKKNTISEIFDKKEFRDENKFKAFRRYIERESHSELENIYDFKDFDMSNFQEAFKKVFEETGYEDHYNKMIS